MGRQGASARLSRMDAGVVGHRVPRHHGGMPERDPRRARVMVSAPDAAEGASGLVGKPQVRRGRRRPDLVSASYCGNTSKAPVFAVMMPKFCNIRPTIMIGAAYQYFDCTRPITCSCSDGSAISRTVAMKFSPPALMTTLGFAITLRTQLRLLFAVPRNIRSPSITNQITTS